MACLMSHNVVYIRHNDKVLCNRANSTFKYRIGNLSSVLLFNKDNRYPYETIQSGTAVTGVCRKNWKIIKRPNSRSCGSLSQKRKKAWLRSIAIRRSNCTTVLTVWRQRSYPVYIRYWFRRRERVKSKGIQTLH